MYAFVGFLHFRIRAGALMTGLARSHCPFRFLSYSFFISSTVKSRSTERNVESKRPCSSRANGQAALRMPPLNHPGTQSQPIREKRLLTTFGMGVPVRA